MRRSPSRTRFSSCRWTPRRSTSGSSLSSGGRSASSARSRWSTRSLRGPRRGLLRRRFISPARNLLSSDRPGIPMVDPELEAIRARKLQQLLEARAGPSPGLPGSGGKPVLITDGTFDTEVRKPGLLLVDFWAAWCGPCLRVAPILEQMAMDLAGTLRIGKLNVDENPRTAERLQGTPSPPGVPFHV